MCANSYPDDLDLKKLRYDLAMEYAKLSLKNAIAEGSICDDHTPKHINELEHLISEFAVAYKYYTDCVGDEQMENRILDS